MAFRVTQPQIPQRTVSAPSSSAPTPAPAVTALLVGGAVVACSLAAWYFLSSRPATAAAQAETKDAVEESVLTKPSPVLSAAAAAAAASPKTAASPKPAAAGAGGEVDAESTDGEEDKAASTSKAVVPARTRTSVISKKDLLNMLSEMHARVSELQANLKGLHESGELSPEDIVEAHSEGIGAIESALHRKYQVSQAELTEAYQLYDGDSKIEQALEKLQALFTIGDNDAEVPEDLTLEVFLEKFNLQNRMTMEAIDAVVKEVIESGNKGPAAMKHFQSIIMGRLSALEAASNEALGMAQSVFMAAFMKYGQDPRVQASAMAVQKFTQDKQKSLLDL